MIELPLAAHPSLAPYEAAAVRSLAVFGASVELALVPGRQARTRRADSPRPPFAPCRGTRIVAEEAYWHGSDLVLTPNRYPFATAQRLLWPTTPRREPDAAMWTAVGTWVDQIDGTALVNTIGAAATIARAHAHLTPERLTFLAQLPERPAPSDLAALLPDVQLVQKNVPFCLLGVRGGSPAARAAALVTLGNVRLSAAWNVCVQAGTAWILPRSLETPAPHFPFALGSAELWGRWCYVDAAAFTEATAARLEQALVLAGVPAM